MSERKRAQAETIPEIRKVLEAQHGATYAEIVERVGSEEAAPGLDIMIAVGDVLESHKNEHIKPTIRPGDTVRWQPAEDDVFYGNTMLPLQRVKEWYETTLVTRRNRALWHIATLEIGSGVVAAQDIAEYKNVLPAAGVALLGLWKARTLYHDISPALRRFRGGYGRQQSGPPIGRVRFGNRKQEPFRY